MTSHDTNQDSLRTILLSIKMITPSYGFTLLQVSKSQKPYFFFKNSCNFCSISHALNCLLHNLKRHCHVQRSFPPFHIRGQTNPVHISHNFYIILTFNMSSEVVTTNRYMSSLSSMTNQYQNARNDHANATTATNCM
jgi:hypothetical protein